MYTEEAYESLEKDILFQKYKDLVGEIINGEVYQILSREVLLIDAEGNEISIPKNEQISKDRFRKGDQVRAIVDHWPGLLKSPFRQPA